MKKFLVPLVAAVLVIVVLVVVRWSGSKNADHHQDDKRSENADEPAAIAPTESDGKIVVSVPNWPSARGRAHILQVVIENNFGVEVELQNSTNPVIFAGMDSGAMHVHPEVWLPNHANLHQKYVEENKTVLAGTKKTDADQGICTTAGTVERTGIKRLEELAAPKMSAKFDTDNDGKGEMWIGATGWASTNVEKIRAKSYGYTETMQLQEMDEMLAIAAIDAAVKKKSNIVFYCYKPHHTFALYDLVILEEAPHDPAQWDVLQPTDDPDWLQKSKALTAWEKGKMYVYYASSLTQTHPAVAKMLSQVEIDSDATTNMTYALVVEKIPVEQFAKDWVQKNSALVDSWLL